MRHDPVRTNFLENTGAYLWQTAAWLSDGEATKTGTVELERASPPTVQDAAVVWPTQASASSTVRWSANTRIVPATRTPLLSQRGSVVSRAVNTKAQSFVEVPVELAELLKSWTPISELCQLTDYGHETDVPDAVIALVRHGLFEIAPRAEATPWGLRREPFVTLTPRTDGDVLVTNLLNGRFLRVDMTTADLIDRLRQPSPIAGPLTAPLLTLVEAGVLRPIGEP